MDRGLQVDQRSHVDADLVRDVGRQGRDPHVADRGDQRPAGLVDGRRVAVEDQRHLDLHLMGQVDQEEVDVQRLAGQRVALDLLDDRAPGTAVTGHLQIQDAGPAGGPVEGLEGLGVDLDRERLDALAEHDTGHQPLAPQLAVLLAGGTACVDGELEIHDGGPTPSVVGPGSAERGWCACVRAHDRTARLSPRQGDR
jgi:hypothetical protein